ncbi:MAG: cyclase family protein [Oscillospiraceae bacterium]|jgi:arylformamidase|nr:cyclase family protein [Oscillospiraceae bacterium]
MEIIDISQPLFSGEVYPGDIAPSFERVRTVERDKYNLTNVTMCVHNGTHVDAPRHFIADGAGVGDLPLELFGGRCEVRVWDGEIPQNCERLIIKNGATGGHVLTEADAERIVGAGVRLVGVESQSVGPVEAPLAVHMILLGGGVIPLEGLRLSHVAEGEYTLAAFPLNLGADCDGAPVRAVLIK